MVDTASFWLFLAAALAIAISPGPGILYVAARTLAGGRAEGIASSIGTGVGGFIHVLGGALGVSALVMASAEAFTVLKLVGAAYLVWLGVRTWRAAGSSTEVQPVCPTGRSRALREGIVVEALNPKTAAFFLAFIPQFIDPSGAVALQFVLLGTISVALNTGMDIVVVLSAASLRTQLHARPRVIRRLRQASGAMMCGLGAALAFARRS